MKEVILMVAIILCTLNAGAAPSPEVQKMMDTPVSMFDMFCYQTERAIDSELAYHNNDNDGPRYMLTAYARKSGVDNSLLYNKLYSLLLTTATAHIQQFWYYWDDDALNVKYYVSIIAPDIAPSALTPEIIKDVAMIVAISLKSLTVTKIQDQQVRNGWQSPQVDEDAFKAHFVDRILVEVQLEYGIGKPMTEEFVSEMITVTVDQNDKVLYSK